MPAQFISGTSGRVQVQQTIVAGVKTWKLDQTTAEIAIPNFESFADSNTAVPRIWPNYLLGLSGATGTMEGWFIEGANVGGVTGPNNAPLTPTDSIITTGIFCTIALLFNKTDLWGFGVNAIITAFGSGSNVENQPATFNASFRVNGAVPLSAITTGF